MATFKTNDGVTIHYEIHGEGKPLLMLAGGSMSGRCFDLSTPTLAEKCQVILMDTRGRGDSDKPRHGHRIARYAMDVKNLLDHLDISDVTILGWSMGVAICWSYLELFSNYRLSQFICVDQSPSQFRWPDWPYGHASSYNFESYLWMCFNHLNATEESIRTSYVGNFANSGFPHEFIETYTEERLKCPGDIGCMYMRDHTHHDWRDLMTHINIPTLVLVGKKEPSTFNWRETSWVGEHIPNAMMVFFENATHTLPLDDPRGFELEVLAFVCGEEA